MKTLFRLSRGTFRFLETDSKRRYKICTCSVILVEIGVFSKLQGLQYYFPENFRRNLTYYASEKIFLTPLSITFWIRKFTPYTLLPNKTGHPERLIYSLWNSLPSEILAKQSFQKWAYILSENQNVNLVNRNWKKL